MQIDMKRAAPKPQTVGVWLVGTAATALLVSSPVDAADLELGRQVFENNCGELCSFPFFPQMDQFFFTMHSHSCFSLPVAAACHTGGYNAVSVEKTLRKADIEKYLDGGFSLEAIEYQIENGKGPMPAWADRLSEDEIKSVAAYVFDQAGGNKW